MTDAAMDPLDPATWDADLRYIFNERAAICEHDGGMTRAEAEEFARVDAWRNYKRG